MRLEAGFRARTGRPVCISWDAASPLAVLLQWGSAEVVGMWSRQRRDTCPRHCCALRGLPVNRKRWSGTLNSAACSRVGRTQSRQRHFQGRVECNVLLRWAWRHDTPTRTLRALAGSSPPLANWATCHQSACPSLDKAMELIDFFYALKGKCVKLSLRNSTYVGFVHRINPNKTLVFADG